jgi:hypothetical protein
VFIVLLVAAGLAASSPLDKAKSLISAGRFDEARALLQDQPGNAETHFLLGLIAVDRRDYRAAIAQFRKALAIDPGSARLRLELARAFYLAKDYSNAEFQFERALAGDLPPAVKANARRFLAQVRREKHWSFGFNFGVAPDTNVNAGSSARETIIFGLPFQLGDDAKMRSGIGAIGAASAEFSPVITGHWRWKVGLAAQRREYGRTRFDETIARGWSGPEWLGENIDVSAAATVLVRWYGGRLYQQAVGGRIETIIYRGSHTAIPLGISGQQFDYPTYPAQSGPVWSASAGLVRILDPTTSATILLSGAMQHARARDLSNRSLLASLGVTRDLRGGFTLTVAPTYAISNYEAPDAFSGIVRRDRSTELRVTILNRRAVIWRFTPTITYTHTRRTSTIGLYDLAQDRVECGLTTQF